MAAAGGDRGRPQPLLARLGRLLPLRQLDEVLRQDRQLQLRSRRALPRRETQTPTSLERRAGATCQATRPDPAPTRRNRRLEARAIQARARHQVKDVGEPCEGKPHARFEAAAGGDQRQSATSRTASGASRRPYYSCLLGRRYRLLALVRACDRRRAAFAGTLFGVAAEAERLDWVCLQMALASES